MEGFRYVAHDGAEPGQHVADDVIAQNEDARLLDLRRQMAVAEQMYNLGRISSDQGAAYLLREACLNPRPIRQMSRERQRMSVLRSASNIPQLGRNEPCHCGSGKKFKKCHGREA